MQSAIKPVNPIEKHYGAATASLARRRLLYRFGDKNREGKR